MGKISEVFYKQISPEICSPKSASEYYFYLNCIGIDPMFHEGYAQYEEEQLCIRNHVIGEALANGEFKSHPKVGSTIFGVSTINRSAVIITELQ